jgi:hypothetical protein
MPRDTRGSSPETHVVGGAELRSRSSRQVRAPAGTICRMRSSTRAGLSADEVESLANALLRAFGQSEEYPFLLEEPAPLSYMVSADAAPGADLVRLGDLERDTPGGQAEGPEGAELLRVLAVLVKVGVVRLATASGHRACRPETASGDRLRSQGEIEDSSGRPAPVAGRMQASAATIRRTWTTSCAVPPYLLPVVASLLVHAHLTPRQRQVARLLLWGSEIKEVAEKLGIAVSTVRRMWAEARKALGKALVEMALARAREESAQESEIPHGPGLRISRLEIMEIFFAESHRFGYRPPRHCVAGKERCRGTGVCKFALPTACLL